MKELLNLLTSRRCHLCLSYTLKLASEGFANRGGRSRSCRSALYLALYSQLQGLGFYKICSSLGYSDRGTRLLCGVLDSPLITGQLSLEQLSLSLVITRALDLLVSPLWLRSLGLQG